MKELDGAVDAMLARAGAAGGSDAAGDPGWDERANAIVGRALSGGARSTAPSASLDASLNPLLDPLLAPPVLAPEPGEPSHVAGDPSLAAPLGAADRSGRTMSDETPKPPSSRRPSLKEMAEAVKNRPSQPPSSAPGSFRPPPSLKDTLVALEGKTPLPAEVGPSSSRPMTPMPMASGARPSVPSSPGPTSTPLPGPASGPVSGPMSGPPTSSPAPSSGHSASAQPVAIAPAAPSSNPHSALPQSAPSTKPSAGVGAKKQGSSMGMGVGIAAIGLAAAAAFAFWTKTKTPDNPTAPVSAAVETSAPAEPSAEEAGKARPTEDDAATPEEGVIDISQLADATGAATAAPAVGGPLPGGPLPTASAVAKKDEKPAGPGEELGDAIRDRAGGGDDAAEEAEPAAGEPSRKAVPDIPPTGAVTSAINAVRGNAKSCVAGADEPSSATITFSSSGAVQGVSVGGWAQGKGAAACIKSALQGARVPPFARPTYATSVTIRP